MGLDGPLPGAAGPGHRAAPGGERAGDAGGGGRAGAHRGGAPGVGGRVRAGGGGGAASEAARQALGSMVRARISVGHAELPELVASRAEGEAVDGRLTRVRVESEAGQRIAELLVFAAHPTLEPRGDRALSGDYPAA